MAFTYHTILNSSIIEDKGEMLTSEWRQKLQDAVRGLNDKQAEVLSTLGNYTEFFRQVFDVSLCLPEVFQVEAELKSCKNNSFFISGL